MTDYGHAPTFGVVLTPSADSPADLVAYARLADAEGLDLLGVIDHSYRPDFLDTFTLLAFIAGQTSHITLFSDVACLPLRPPGVLAKIVSSLSLLSGDRAVLGLGAGGLWSEIASLGGPLRSPGEAIAALSEAIDVIRALTGGAGALTHEGEFYRLDGVTAGPHADIPVWIGAYRPKILQLVGEKGDGWIPSDMFLTPDGFAESNRRIDDAALAAGRSPADIRRLYNISGHFPPYATGSGFLQGPPDLWVEHLTELALDQGVSGFILSPGDDRTEQIQIFAREVAPAVAESIAKART
jgi:alkanesulfonate monooxygenase SsuD/methylene tetrahydromethanopterin reductase-like flavin-dependent oxidoreductase (luciferase family)